MLNKLSDTIYYLSHQDDRERPTLGLVCGEQYSLIIDSGNSTQHAKDFLLEIEKLNVPPIKYLVITHAHWDHFLGMNEFDATVIVNSQTNERLKEWQIYKFDDHSLLVYVNTNQMSAKGMEIIQTDIPNRESFKLNSPNVIFENTLTIDLGNKVCIIERIKSTHTDDSTIIYIPDEKVIFLGDAAYGTTANSLFHFKQSLLLPMINDIQKYDAKMFLLGHESICDSDEMNLYWEELITASRAVQSTSLEDAIECFKVDNNRDPNDNELFFIQAFVNDRIVQSY
ncbi:hydrolase glyoxylase [Lysinibacillus sphaericus]|uniref:MBL fold metallo-hydrolase n=1 Tax=Lysinibacillus sphaericus TaxID=1421 RepID=UPI0018CEB7CD|nr:MBL fold metallo-hydrolase [Lysinibacillus sphaericus]MBG9453830.1 hydrolase glyoxylase [Lysinibacillus sphaericus]MBG9476300.1 hydrolase glyoxylase [Lysinibacillus sphaericus]MBG9591715.1 hydrolase glyoxylase [Lysinibacillus sphaericus]